MTFPRQPFAGLFHLHDVAIQRPCDHRRGEFRACRASCLEEPLFLGGQTIDLAGDHLPQVARDVILGYRPPLRQAPVSVDFKDLTLGDGTVDKGDDEQGLSAGSPKNPPGQPLGHIGFTEPQCEVLLDLRQGQFTSTSPVQRP